MHEQYTQQANSAPDIRTPDYRFNRHIAERIAGYWAERGHSVRLEIVNDGFMPSMRCAVHGVRSDMRGGMPAKRGARA